MTGETTMSAPLATLSVLVVEDDFYQADDVQRLCADAGATVIGPFGKASPALAAVERQQPDCAVIDLNLGGGPSFDLPRALKARGIPLLIVSGYDASVIPPDLQDAPRLEKPLDRHALVGAVLSVLEERSRRS